MFSILEQAVQTVTEREIGYCIIVADLYFTATLAGDTQTTQQIWHEAWRDFNGAQIAALVSADLQLRVLEESNPRRDE